MDWTVAHLRRLPARRRPAHRSGWPRTLSRNGQVFLEDVFAGSEALAHAVNRLLVVGFYLLNLGFVSLYLRIGRPDVVGPARRSSSSSASRSAWSRWSLGVVHFLNVYVFNAMRRRQPDGAPSAPRRSPPQGYVGRSATGGLPGPRDRPDGPAMTSTSRSSTDAGCPLCSRFARLARPCSRLLVPLRAGAGGVGRGAGAGSRRSTTPARCEEITVVGDDGAVWTHEHAWVMCLWATRRAPRAWPSGSPVRSWLPLARRRPAYSSARPACRHLLAPTSNRRACARGGDYPDDCAGSCRPAPPRPSRPGRRSSTRRCGCSARDGYDKTTMRAIAARGRGLGRQRLLLLRLQGAPDPGVLRPDPGRARRGRGRGPRARAGLRRSGCGACCSPGSTWRSRTTSSPGSSSATPPTRTARCRRSARSRRPARDASIALFASGRRGLRRQARGRAAPELPRAAVAAADGRRAVLGVRRQRPTRSARRAAGRQRRADRRPAREAVPAARGPRPRRRRRRAAARDPVMTASSPARRRGPSPRHRGGGPPAALWSVALIVGAATVPSTAPRLVDERRWSDNASLTLDDPGRWQRLPELLLVVAIPLAATLPRGDRTPPPSVDVGATGAWVAAGGRSPQSSRRTRGRCTRRTSSGSSASPRPRSSRWWRSWPSRAHGASRRRSAGET